MRNRNAATAKSTRPVHHRSAQKQNARSSTAC